MEQTRMKRWNLFGYLFSIIVTFALIGLIMYGKDHKAQLEEVMYVLTVILVVAFFAIIRRNVKQICKNKIICYAQHKVEKILILYSYTTYGSIGSMRISIKR